MAPISKYCTSCDRKKQVNGHLFLIRERADIGAFRHDQADMAGAC
jgi:hypothetical protein